VPGVQVASQLFEAWLTGSEGGEVGKVVVMRYSAKVDTNRRAPAVEPATLTRPQSSGRPSVQERERTHLQEPGRIECVG
jgi:hypothetical protein